jgi:putative glutamine amidotransferase
VASADWPVAAIRFARPTDRLPDVLRFYEEGLGLRRIDSFEGHAGYSGVMLGLPDPKVQLELTAHAEGSPGPAPTRGNLLVLYMTDRDAIAAAEARMRALGQTPGQGRESLLEVRPHVRGPGRVAGRAPLRRLVTVRPIVGITSYAEEAHWGVWDAPAALIPVAYVRAVEQAGGRALLVPPSSEAVEETLDALHGLLLSGGADIDPASYGSEPHPETDDVRPERDRAELALLEAALARDMPVLAVCRGSQVLNVALGGDLVQHLPEVVGHEGHKQLPGVFADHDVDVLPETKLHEVLGERAPVKSHHHQGYGRLGEGLREAARAEDGTVEAIEDPSRRFALGVLWHPEEGEDATLFTALVEEAKRYRAERS